MDYAINSRARHNPEPRSEVCDGEICGGVMVESASDDFPQQKKLENLLPNFTGSSPPISPKTSPTSLWKWLVLITPRYKLMRSSWHVYAKYFPDNYLIRFWCNSYEINFAFLGPKKRGKIPPNYTKLFGQNVLLKSTMQKNARIACNLIWWAVLGHQTAGNIEEQGEKTLRNWERWAKHATKTATILWRVLLGIFDYKSGDFKDFSHFWAHQLRLQPQDYSLKIRGDYMVTLVVRIARPASLAIWHRGRSHRKPNRSGSPNRSHFTSLDLKKHADFAHHFIVISDQANGFSHR